MTSPKKAEKMPLLYDSKSTEWNNNSTESDSVLIDIEGYSPGLNNRREKNGDIQGNLKKINLPPPETKFPPEKGKTVLAFLFVSFALFLNLICLSFIHDRVPSTPPLPDVFFDLFPAKDWALDVSEIIIIVSVWVTIISILVHRHRWIVFRRVFMMMGIVYFVRSITMFVTQVPVASTTYYCSPKANHTTALLVMKRVVHLMAGMGLSINGQHIFCGDYIFSGHTVILTMSYLMINEYTSDRCWLLKKLSFLSSVVGVYMVLLSHGHYMVDVVIAYFVTTQVFWTYHTMANNAHLKLATNPPTSKCNYETNYLSRVWWFGLFQYFEKNVSGPVPRQYEFHLPWRKLFRRIRKS